MARHFEIFWRFLVLGCFSFGGPAAHLGYFRTAFVEKLKWIDDAEYAKLIALSQFLPGPGSSQVGFALGLQKGGLLGGMAAFVGFTLPSFLLIFFASTLLSQTDSVWLQGLIHGLKLLAVVVVADATLGMAKNFCQTTYTQAIAVFTAVALLAMPNLWLQLVLLGFAAAVGSIWLAPNTPSASVANTSRQTNAKNTARFGFVSLALFFVLLLGLPLVAQYDPWLNLFSDFYQSGSLVFGGGHVVLPLLQQTVGEALSTDRFLLGYAFAQAVPGPMFTMATFLGAEVMPQQAWLGALVATLAIFLPGFLLVLACHKAWQALANRPRIAGAVVGVNASVVGLLLAALYSPVFISAVGSPVDFAAVVVGFFVLRVVKPPILVLVAGFACVGMLL